MYIILCLPPTPGIIWKYQRKERTMEERLIYGGEATLEDLYRLHMLGYEFVIEDGQITNVLHK